LVAVNQPGSLFTRDAYEAVGGLSKTLDYVMDTDLYFKLLRHGPYVHLNRWLAGFRVHPEAKTVARQHLALAEYAEAIELWSRTSPAVGKLRQARALHTAWQLLNGNYVRMGIETARARQKRWDQWSIRNCSPPRNT
jgi:GT2 family glycosyltransferase